MVKKYSKSEVDRMIERAVVKAVAKALLKDREQRFARQLQQAPTPKKKLTAPTETSKPKKYKRHYINRTQVEYIYKTKYVKGKGYRKYKGRYIKSEKGKYSKKRTKILVIRNPKNLKIVERKKYNKKTYHQDWDNAKHRNSFSKNTSRTFYSNNAYTTNKVETIKYTNGQERAKKIPHKKPNKKSHYKYVYSTRVNNKDIVVSGLSSDAENMTDAELKKDAEEKFYAVLSEQTGGEYDKARGKQYAEEHDLDVDVGVVYYDFYGRGR